MKLTEARRNRIILVDFQPAYQSDDWGYNDAIESAIDYINNKQPLVTAFFNGSDVGIEDTANEVLWHYVEHGLDEDLIGLFDMKEKSYAWLRNWMDQGVDPSIIIKTVRYMVMNDLNDSREIDDEVFAHLVGVEDLDDFPVDRDDGIYIPDISVAHLKSFSGALLGGGGKHECLRELELFMNAFNIKYKRVKGWIYG